MKMKYVVLLCIILVATLATISCGGEPQIARDGDKVFVHYTGTLDDGSQFDSSAGREPLSFTVGAGQMISGFDNAVRGMKVGESKTVTLSPAEAYGEYRQDLVVELPREQLPEGMQVQLGQQLQVTSSGGAVMIATVIEISDDTITLDANHRLAGKDLTFKIELIKLEPAE